MLKKLSASVLAVSLLAGCAKSPSPSDLSEVVVYAASNPSAEPCERLQKLEDLVDYEPDDPTHTQSDEAIWFDQIQRLCARSLQLGGNGLLVESQIQSVGANGGDQYWTIGYALACPK